MNEKSLMKQSRWEPPTTFDNNKKSLGIIHSSFNKTQSDADQDWKRYMLKMQKQIKRENVKAERMDVD